MLLKDVEGSGGGRSAEGGGAVGAVRAVRARGFGHTLEASKYLLKT